MTPFGASGAPAGITEADAGESAEVVTTVVDVTVKLYDVPLLNPRIVHEVAPVVLHVNPPGLAVAVYPVIGKPRPSPRVQETVADASPRTALTDVGGNGGTPTTMEAVLTADEVPTVLVAVTAKV